LDKLVISQQTARRLIPADSGRDHLLIDLRKQPCQMEINGKHVVSYKKIKATWTVVNLTTARFADLYIVENLDRPLLLPDEQNWSDSGRAAMRPLYHHIRTEGSTPQVVH
jgi:hypothetical protein